MMSLAQRLAGWLGLDANRLGAVDAATYARARRSARRTLVIRVLVTAIMLVLAGVCLVRSQIAGAVVLGAGAAIQMGSVMLWRSVLRRVEEGAAEAELRQNDEA
jgi:hypothetical protein